MSSNHHQRFWPNHNISPTCISLKNKGSHFPKPQQQTTKALPGCFKPWALRRWRFISKCARSKSSVLAVKGWILCCASIALKRREAVEKYKKPSGHEKSKKITSWTMSPFLRTWYWFHLFSGKSNGYYLSIFFDQGTFISSMMDEKIEVLFCIFLQQSLFRTLLRGLLVERGWTRWNDGWLLRNLSVELSFKILIRL